MALPDFLRPLVLFGPSGAGKSSLLKRLFAAHPDNFAFSVSHTTRLPRPGESDGVHYHFVSKDSFRRMIDDVAFIEHVEFSGNLYGTSLAAVRSIADQGKRCILDIDAQGVRLIKATSLDPVYLFICPPSLDALRSRLIGRGTETDASIAKRLQTALKEVSYAQEPNAYDYLIVNDDLDRAYQAFETAALGGKISGDTLPSFDV